MGDTGDEAPLNDAPRPMTELGRAERAANEAVLRLTQQRLGTSPEPSAAPPTRERDAAEPRVPPSSTPMRKGMSGETLLGATSLAAVLLLAAGSFAGWWHLTPGAQRTAAAPSMLAARTGPGDARQLRVRIVARGNISIARLLERELLASWRSATRELGSLTLIAIESGGGGCPVPATQRPKDDQADVVLYTCDEVAVSFHEGRVRSGPQPLPTTAYIFRQPAGLDTPTDYIQIALHEIGHHWCCNGPGTYDGHWIDDAERAPDGSWIDADRIGLMGPRRHPGVLRFSDREVHEMGLLR